MLVRPLAILLLFASLAGAQQDAEADRELLRGALELLAEQPMSEALVDTYRDLHGRAWRLGDGETAQAAIDRVVEWWTGVEGRGSPVLAIRLETLAAELEDLGDQASAGRLHEVAAEVPAPPSEEPGGRFVVQELELEPEVDSAEDAATRSWKTSWVPPTSGALSAWVSGPGGEGSVVRILAPGGGVLSEPRDSLREARPYARVEVEAGRELVLQVEGLEDAGSRAVRVVLAPVSEATRAAAASARGLTAQAASLLGGGDPARTHHLVFRASEVVRLAPGWASCARVAEALRTAGTLARTLGDLALSERCRRSVLAFEQGVLPEECVQIQLDRVGLSNVLRDLGDLEEARALDEGALAALTATLSEGSGEVLGARQNLAITLKFLGELQAARALEESVLEVRARTLPPDHPDLAWARGNLAITLKNLGDAAGARVLEEQVLEVRSRTLPPDHQDLQMARQNLANTCGYLGDVASARRLHEAVLASFERTLSEQSPMLQGARVNLAQVLASESEYEAAIGLLERAEAGLARGVSVGSPSLPLVRFALAEVLLRSGEAERALELLSSVREQQGRLLPGGHLHLQSTLMMLLEAQRAAGRPEQARRTALDLSHSLVAGLRDAVGRSSPSEVEDLAVQRQTFISELVDLAVSEPHADGALVDAALAAVEAARSAALLTARLEAAVVGSQPGAAREDERRAAWRLARLVSAGAPGGPIEAARRELDRLRRARVERLAADETARELLREASPRDLADRLAEGEVALLFWQADTRREHRMVAFVLRPGASPAAVDLGPTDAIEEAVARWRAALGAAREGRGVPVAAGAPAPPDERSAGLAVGRLVLDPLGPHLDGARRLTVVPDGSLHLVPLDALPFGSARVGDRFEVVVRASARELAFPQGPIEGASRLVVLGGADFEGGSRGGSSTVRGTPAGRVRGQDAEHRFAPLPGTRREAQRLAGLWQETHETPPTVLVGADATAGAVARLAPDARYLHLATHGWFSDGAEVPAGGAVSLDESLRLTSRTSAGETVRSTSPMLLCGLAFAGANRRGQAWDRIEGVLTAEELATWDLTRTELAVLSACETHVGVGRGGQGLASLQKALRMAGARSVITSLWKVPDDATAELMVDLYRRLWVEQVPRHRALWEAKRRLRDLSDDDGRPRYTTRDWAGWVLTGDP